MGGFSLMGNQIGGMPADAYNRVTRGGPFARRKFTFGTADIPEAPEAFAGFGAGEPGSVPLGRLPAPMEAVPVEGPAPPTRLQRMESDLDAMDNPEISTKQKLLGALMSAAPAALGGLFGGAEGAAGAAAGTGEFLDQARAGHMERRRSLLEEMEAERNRGSRLDEAAMAAESRENVAGMTNEFRRSQDEWKREHDLMKIRIAQQKARGYMDNIESLMQSREAGTALGRDKLKLQADELQRRIDRDADLDENAKAELGQRLLVHRETMAQRQAEESGRTQRTQITQEYAGQRQQRLMDKGWTPSQIASAWNYALKGAQNLGTWGDMDEQEQADLVEGLANSFLSQRMPELSTDVEKGFFSDTKKQKAAPGAPAEPRIRDAAPRPPAGAPAAAPAPAASAQPSGQTYVNPKTGERIRWDGTKWVPATR